MAEIRIGVTERGDAGLDFSWYDRLNYVDGAILITKKLSDDFIEKIISAPKPVILHCTCTGWGGSFLEPNVPDYKTQLNYLKKLIDKNFDTNRIIIRIDPIIPTNDGLERTKNVLDYILDNNIPIRTIRFSILDQYKHVCDRLQKINMPVFYPDNNFTATPEMCAALALLLLKYPMFTFEACAEPMFIKTLKSANINNFVESGCVNKNILSVLNIPIPDNLSENLQNRKGCHCLSCKTELLTNKKQCPNKCLYCYWK